MKNKKFQFLYITREKHPTYRVDLTQLFSNGIAKKGHHIDWHMDSVDSSQQAATTDTEGFFLSQTSSKKGVILKVLNKLFILLHTFKVFKLVANNAYDFVQVRDKVFIGIIASIAARRKKIPFYYWLSFPHAESDILRSKDYKWSKNPLKKLFLYCRGRISHFTLYKLVLPRADFIFVQSDRMLEDLTKEGVPVEKMMPVPMGINLADVDLAAPKAIDPELKDRKMMIYLGTMIYERRIDFLLDMLPDVIEQFPNVLLLLVGSASDQEMDFLKNKVAELGIEDNVLFTGFIPMEKGWEYIRNSAIGLSPFRPSPILDSTSPTKLVEYMAWGIPVVANTHPDQSVVIGESGAGYAIDYTPEAFSKACLLLLKDPLEAERMGGLGVSYVKHNRSYEYLVNKLEDKYLDLLNK